MTRALEDRETCRPRGSALGLLGASLLLLAGGCPDTIPGTTKNASDAGSGHPTIEWRQTFDVSAEGLSYLRGWIRVAADGKRAYVPTWGEAAAVMTVDDGLLSAPIAMPLDTCNLSDIRFRADGQIAFVGAYYKWGHACGKAVSAYVLQADGTFASDALSEAFEGMNTTDPQPPDFSESIVLHPSEAWLYVGFANTYLTNMLVTKNSQIGRVDVAPDGTFSNEKLVDLDSGGTLAMTLSFSQSGETLYAVQRDTGGLNRLHVDGSTGDLTLPAAVAAVPALADIGPTCTFGGKEHVYVASAPESHDDLGGGVHHFVFDGVALVPIGVAGPSHHPGLFRVHSIVADQDCRYLFAVGERATTQSTVHVLEIDPATGDPIWVSEAGDVAQMAKRYRLSLSPDGRFLYAVGWFQHTLHAFELVAPP